MGMIDRKRQHLTYQPTCPRKDGNGGDTPKILASFGQTTHFSIRIYKNSPVVVFAGRW
jgi:hypothetical protein